MDISFCIELEGGKRDGEGMEAWIDYFTGCTLSACLRWNEDHYINSVSEFSPSKRTQHYLELHLGWDSKEGMATLGKCRAPYKWGKHTCARSPRGLFVPMERGHLTFQSTYGFLQGVQHLHHIWEGDTIGDDLIWRETIIWRWSLWWSRSLALRQSSWGFQIILLCFPFLMIEHGICKLFLRQ